MKVEFRRHRPVASAKLSKRIGGDPVSGKRQGFVAVEQCIGCHVGQTALAQGLLLVSQTLKRKGLGLWFDASMGMPVVLQWQSPSDRLLKQQSVVGGRTVR
jgi:hypothetical protein